MSRRPNERTVWHAGLPPKDGRTYRVRQRVPMINGEGFRTVQDVPEAFWVGDRLHRRSAMGDFLVPLVLMNEWSEETRG